MHNRGGGGREGRGREYQIFPLKNHCPTVPKNLRKETLFCLNASILVNNFKQLQTRQLHKISFSEVFYKLQFDQRFLYFYGKEGVSRLAVQNFRLTVPKFLLMNQSVYQKFSIFEEVFCMTRAYHDFVSKNFCLTGPKNFVSGQFCFTNFLVSKKILDERGGGGEYQHFLSIFFISQCRKI